MSDDKLALFLAAYAGRNFDPQDMADAVLAHLCERGMLHDDSICPEHTRAIMLSAGWEKTNELLGQAERALAEARKALREIGERAIVDWQDELVGLTSVGLGTADWDSVTTMEQGLVRDLRAQLARAEQQRQRMREALYRGVNAFGFWLEWAEKRDGNTRAAREILADMNAALTLPSPVTPAPAALYTCPRCQHWPCNCEGAPAAPTE